MSRFALYTSTFPLLTTTFIQREVRAFTSAGFDLLLIANHKPGPDQYHIHDTDILEKTIYIDKLPIFHVLLEHIRLITRHPWKWTYTLLTLFTKRNGILKLISNLKLFWAAGALAMTCRKQGISHIHVHFAFGAAAVSLFWSKITGGTYSISIHGSDVILPRDLTREKVENASYIISNCHFHTKNLPSRFSGLNVKRFHIVRIGLDLYSQPWTVDPVFPPCDILRVFAVGRLIEVKAFHILIDACLKVAENGRKIICRIGGDGPLRQQLEKQVANSRYPEIIEFIGPLSENRVSIEMSRSHVVALSSLSEGTPMCLIEAMAKARAVIAPRITAIPEVVEDGKTGLLFKSESVEDCANALMNFTSMTPEMLEHMGICGREKAEREFNLNVNINRLIDIHREELSQMKAK